MELYKTTRDLNKALYNQYFRLCNLLDHREMEAMVFDEEEEYIKKKVDAQTKNIKKKLADLMLKNPENKEKLQSTKHEFAPRIENMSEVQFTEEDERPLVKGIKYNQPERLTQKKLEELTISCEQVIRTMKYDERPDLKPGPGLEKYCWISKET